ncbi:MAG TPA: hypothetical protein VH583_09180 [Vicinamibacterales bacterium]|jgi:hypothetical protein
MPIERKIYFYRSNCGFAPGGEPIPFPVTAVADAIDALDFATGERYLASYADVRTCCWVARAGANARLRFANIRHGGLPEVDQAGVLTPLDIPDNANLAESVYIRFFPNQIVGAVYNFYGPRLPQLAYYLRVKVGDVLPPRGVQFDPLLRSDVLQRLQTMDRLTLFELRIHRSYLESLKAIDETLGRAFEASFEAGDGIQAEISLRASRATDDTLFRRLRRIARRISRGSNDSVLKLVVRGGPNGSRKTDLVDLLSDELLVTREIEVVQERHRALNPESAFAAIDDAYDELHDVLEAEDALGEEDA